MAECNVYWRNESLVHEIPWASLARETIEEDDSNERVWYLSHRVSRWELTPGDHIYVYRMAGAYNHHGIYVGEEDCEVIHFSGTSGKASFVLNAAMLNVGRFFFNKIDGKKSNAKVQKTSLEDFCDGSELRLAAYDCNTLTTVLSRGGTCYVDKSRPADDVIATAKYYLENPESWPKYNVETNNCAHFAYYCKTGKELLFGGVSLHRTLNPFYKIVSDLFHGVTAN